MAGERDTLRRVEYARTIKDVLEVGRETDCVNVIPGDETWLYNQFEHTHAYSQPGDPRPTFTVEDQGHKDMATILFSPNGFHLLDILPENKTNTARYFITHILRPLSDACTPLFDFDTNYRAVRKAPKFIHPP